LQAVNNTATAKHAFTITFILAGFGGLFLPVFSVAEARKSWLEGTMGSKLRTEGILSAQAPSLYGDFGLMNVHATMFVRLACWLLLAVGALPLAAQRDGKSLTKDFSKLSAKERSRIAEQETREAALDSGYQRVMHTADLAFQQERYEDALAAFQEARKLRPYNVYPKVKIQDLQALIKKKKEEAADQAAETPRTNPTPKPDPEPAPAAIPASPQIPEEHPAPAAEPADIAPAPQPSAEKPDTQRSLPAPVPPPHQPATIQDPKAAAPPPGERIYKEAGAVVTERTVPDDGRIVTYKKVVHPWGQTFYFREGRAIPSRVWEERFNGE
jgi:hypothetical protein